MGKEFLRIKKFKALKIKLLKYRLIVQKNNFRWFINKRRKEGKYNLWIKLRRNYRKKILIRKWD